MWGWLIRPPVAEPQHALVTVLHEGVPAGDVTVEGWITGERAGHLLMDKARIVMSDNSTKPDRAKPGVALEIPLRRVILRQPVSTVSVTQLDALVAAA